MKHQQTAAALLRIIVWFVCAKISIAIGATPISATEPFILSTAQAVIVDIENGDPAEPSTGKAKASPGAAANRNAAAGRTLKLSTATPANDKPANAKPANDKPVNDKSATKKKLTPEAIDTAEPKADRMQGILKPMHEIVLQPAQSDAMVPTNRAEAMLPGYDVYLGPASSPPLAPQRYTIHSIHNPLYYEEVNLERCGHGHGCATATVSALHFMSSTVLLPYRLASESPCKTQCSYGDCRCCESMPCQRPLQCSVRSVASQMAISAGFVFLLL